MPHIVPVIEPGRLLVFVAVLALSLIALGDRLRMGRTPAGRAPSQGAARPPENGRPAKTSHPTASPTSAGEGGC